MSQAQRHHAPGNAAPDFDQLIPLNEAAVILRKNKGQLRRLCAEKLMGRNMAVCVRPPSGGKPKWFIDRRYNIALARGEAGKAHQSPSLVGYKPTQIAQANLRADCVASFRRARQTWKGAQKVWLPKLLDELAKEHPTLKISRSSLLRWYDAYQTPGDLVKLIDGRGGDQRSGADPAAWDAFRKIYLDDREPTMKSCWRRVADEAKVNNWKWVTYDTLKRSIDDNIEPEVQMKYRQPDKWRKTMQPYIDQDTESFAAGECWIGDHKQLDFWCRGGSIAKPHIFRPWFTAWIDWKSRRVAGWCLSDSPNSSTILAALRHGIMDPANKGGPSVVWIDNGKDYDSWTFHGRTKAQRKSRIKIESDESQARGVFRLLQIEAHFSIAYNPNGKARCERWFRNTDDFASSMTTYCGQSIEAKPEKLNELLAKKRTQIPTFDHTVERFTQFIKGMNARTDHAMDDLVDEDTGARLSPDQALAKWCVTRHVMADQDTLDLLLQIWHKPVQAGRNGVTIKIGSKSYSYGQFDQRLSPFKAPKKKDAPLLHVSYDPMDTSMVRVYDDRYQPVGEMTLNGVGGFKATEAQMKKLQRGKAAYSKALNVVDGSYKLQYLTDAEMLADSAAQDEIERRAPGSSPAMNSKLIQTPLDGKSKAVKQQKLKAAVGAEHDQIPDGEISYQELLPGPGPGPGAGAGDVEEDFAGPISLCDFADSYCDDAVEDESGGGVEDVSWQDFAQGVDDD